MKISLDKMLNFTGKIAELTAGEKIVVDTMFIIGDNTLRICHSNGHKSYVEDFEVETEDTDIKQKFVVNTDEIIKIVRGFQTTGAIKVSDVKISFNTNLSVMVLYIENFMESKDETGEVIGTRVTGNKTREIKYNTDFTDIRVSILNRVNYDELFENNGCSTFKRAEVIEKFDKTAIEKGKVVYLSPSMQNVFVYNTAYATDVPFERKEITPVEAEEVKSSMVSSGEYTDEAYAKKLDEMSRVLNVKGAFTQTNARMIANILNKSNSDEVDLVAGDKAVNFVVSNNEESFAISIETAVDQGLMVKQFMKSRDNKYEKMQLVFIKDCILDVLNSVADDKIDKKELRFELREDGLYMTVRNQGASKASAEVLVYNMTDTGCDVTNEKIVISGKVLNTAIKQLKTQNIAFDLAENRSLRVAEINDDKWAAAYNEVRQKTAEKCASLGVEFDPETTKSDTEFMLASRDKYLETRQYLMSE